MDAIEELTRRRILPVVVADNTVPPIELAHALVNGGLPIAEVTLRTPSALNTIADMAAHSELLVGAGTVRTPEAVDRAVDAGARFIVSPGLRADVVRRGEALGVTVIPGCVTPTEIMAAEELGLTTVKFFPAEQYGGRGALAALSGPFADISLIPTGGIGQENLGEYLSLPTVAAVGGSWMVAPARWGDLDEVVRCCRAAVTAAQEAHL